MAEISKTTDLETITAAYAVHRASFSPKSPDFLSFEGFKGLCSFENTALLTARTPGGGVIGYALFRNLGVEAELLSLAVEKNHKKQGVGKKLGKKMMADLTKEECQSIFLEVSEKNQPARAFYRSLGAENLTTRKNYYTGPSGSKENALIKKISLR